MNALELLYSAEASLLAGLEFGQSSWSQTPEVARSLLSASLGVFFGAWVTSRSQNKRLIVAELHALRGAYILCFAIVNKALAIKRQHVRPMKAAFDANLAYLTNPQGPIALQLDLRDLSQIRFPTEALEKLVLEKCFLGSEAISTLVAVMDASSNLNTAIDYRNEQVIDFKEKPPESERERVERYFGLPGQGERDERIKNNLTGLLAYSDDCIFFGRHLGDHIMRAENRLRRKTRWKYLLPGRKLKPAIWKRAEAEGLLPFESDYVNWTSGFVKDRSIVERLYLSLRKLGAGGL